MLDTFLFLIIALLVGVIVYVLHQAQKERKIIAEQHTIDKNKLINALVARKPEELRDLTLADKVGPIAPAPEQKPPDMIPMEQLSDEDFDSAIQDQLANG